MRSRVNSVDQRGFGPPNGNPVAVLLTPMQLLGGLLGAGAVGGVLGYWWSTEGSRLRRRLVYETTLSGSAYVYRRRLTREGKPFLLSNGEQRFYLALRQAVGEEFDVHFKLRVADIIVPTEGNWQRGYGEAVAKQHVDFTLCKKRTSYPVCCVELDDKSHERELRRQRDEFLDAAFKSARVPLVHVPARHPKAPYDVGAIRAVVLDATEVDWSTSTSGSCCK